MVATTPMTLYAMLGTSLREMEAELPDVATRIRTAVEARQSSS